MDAKAYRDREKAFPWGLCPAQRIEINMTAGGSHTAAICHAAKRDWGGVIYQIPQNLPAWRCRGGGMPRPLEFHTQNRRGVRLLLEEKLAARQG